jgi:hypothetical protein
MNKVTINKEGYLSSEIYGDGIYTMRFVPTTTSANKIPFVYATATFTREEFENEDMSLYDLWNKSVIEDIYCLWDKYDELGRISHSKYDLAKDYLGMSYGETGLSSWFKLDIFYNPSGTTIPSDIYKLKDNRRDYHNVLWQYKLRRLLESIEKRYYNINNIIKDKFMLDPIIEDNYEDLKNMTKDEISNKYSKDNYDKIIFGLMDYENNDKSKEFRYK